MKDEAIPEMLKELLLDNDNSMVVDNNNNNNQKEHFMTNFDPHPNAIIYHAHSHAHTSTHTKINPTLPNLSP